MLRARARPLVGARARHRFALGAFLVAFAVRAFWTLRVQSPLNAVYSDMGGYVSRAEMLLAGTMPGEPRILALWPWGTHAIVALEFAVFGRHGAVGIALTHAFVGALCAPAATLLSARFVRSRMAPALAGLGVALWHPHIVFSGYFSSEIWFSAAITLASLFFVRHCERARRRDAIATGLLIAVAFVVRPQIVLTSGMIGGLLFLAWISRTSWRPRLHVVALLLPLLVAIGFSSVRLYRLSGRIGMINLYEQAQRLFGETSVGKLDAAWIAPNGERWTWWAAPHTKRPVKPQDAVRIDGFIADPEKLAAIRAERLRGVPWTARVARAADNVKLLALRNVPWPEDEEARRAAFRVKLQIAFGNILMPVLALCAIGLCFLRRHRMAAVVLWTQLTTIVFVGAVYLGEARYRVPYDPFILIAASVGVDAVVSRARLVWRRRAPTAA